MSPFNKQRNKRSDFFEHPLIRFIGVALFVLVAWLIFRSIVSKHTEEVPAVYGDVVESAFHSRRSLMSKVAELETTINSYEARLSELSVLQSENDALKGELGRGPDVRGTIAHVLTFPNRSFYDTMAIDAGSEDGIVLDQTAYAFGEIALGTISQVRPHSATVLLFSAPNRETTGTATGSDVSVTLIGRGNGEYEVRMPRDMHFDTGGMIAYQSIHTAIIAQIEKIITDPRDPFQRLLAKAPVNLQALKWVIVK
jgi:cell shape-determining protein MreC